MCPGLAYGAQFCDKHTKKKRQRYDRKRGTSTQRGYGAAWQKLRRMVLAEQPVCAGVHNDGSRCLEAATDVDHIIPKSRGGTDERANLQGLCHSHHSAKTRREQNEKWAGVRPDGVPRHSWPVTLICGPPAAGKTTLANSLAKDGDRIFDLDVIRAEVGGDLDDALAERNKRIAQLASEKPTGRAYFIVSAPTVSERRWWRAALGAKDVVVLATSEVECHNRIDANRSGDTEAKQAVTEWWARAALDPRSERVVRR